ncbi:MAG: hypothetical protein IPP51_10140 [Bacteroidetes bacterium]|nr:hypothetical protein [Bacteroidota bacterium]
MLQVILFNYKEKGSTVELVDKEDMEGTEVYKLKITKKSGDVSYVFLDASSYIMLKQTNVIKMADKEVRTTTIMSNFQDVEGYKFPFTIEVRGGDGEEQGQAMAIEKVLVNPVIADSEYAMPEVKPAAPATQEHLRKNKKS